MKTISIHFDGACEPFNPGGNMGMGVVIRDVQTGDLLQNLSAFIEQHPDNSNNVAEYLALILGMEWLIQNGYQKDRIKVYGDSQLVIKQMSGEWNAKAGLYLDAYKKAIGLRLKFPLLSLAWIPRNQNADADNLSKSHINKTDQ